MQGIRIGMMGMQGIKVEMRGIEVEMQGIGGRNKGNHGQNLRIGVEFMTKKFGKGYEIKENVRI